MISPGLLVWGILSLFAVAGLWLVPIALSTWQARKRGKRRLLGFVLGLVLGWVGFVILLLVSGPAVSGREPAA